MSLCNQCKEALPLVLCGDEDAIVFIGTTTDPVTYVRLRSLATGRIVQYDAVYSSGAIAINPADGEVIAGDMYEVTMLVGEVPVPFAPYVVSGYSVTPAADEYDCVVVEWEYVPGYEVGDQYLTLE